MTTPNRAYNWRKLRRALYQTQAFATLATASSLDLSVNALSTQLIVELNTVSPSAQVVSNLLSQALLILSPAEIEEINSLLLSSEVILPDPVV